MSEKRRARLGRGYSSCPESDRNGESPGPHSLPPMSLIFATQLAAVATAALAVFAIVTAYYAPKAFRSQSKEVSDQAEMLKVQAEMLKVQSEQFAEQQEIYAEQIRVLKLQAAELRESLDERKREAEQRRSAQAAKVFMSQDIGEIFRQEDDDGPESISVSVTVVNTSDRPIYDTGLDWRPRRYDDFIPERLGTIMPGRETMRRRYFPPDFGVTACGAVLIFRDAAGVTWKALTDAEPAAGCGLGVVMPGVFQAGDRPGVLRGQAFPVPLGGRLAQLTVRPPVLAEKRHTTPTGRPIIWAIADLRRSRSAGS